MASLSCACISSVAVNVFEGNACLSQIQPATAVSTLSLWNLPKKSRINGSRIGRNLVVRSVEQETASAASDIVSTFSIPGLPADNPWIAAIGAVLVGVPFMIQRLLSLSKEVDAAAQTIERIADTVGKVADEVDKAAEQLGDALPEGQLKKLVDYVEDMAEGTSKGSQVVEDLMDKVEEIDDKLEALVNKQVKSSD